IFFQAEDGIRDSSVTGVQTCALPILVGYSNVLDGRVTKLNSLEYPTIVFEDLIITLFNDIMLRYTVRFDTTEFYAKAVQQQFTKIGRASCREIIKIICRL